MIYFFGVFIDVTFFLTIFFGVTTIVLSILLYIKSNQSIEKQLMKSFFHLYADRFNSASSEVSDLFFDEGVKLMKQQKWDMAIVKFRKAVMPDAKASQLVALYSFIGLCEYAHNQLELAIENWNKSLSLAKDCEDEKGKRASLGCLSLIIRPQDKLSEVLQQFGKI